MSKCFANEKINCGKTDVSKSNSLPIFMGITWAKYYFSFNNYIYWTKFPTKKVPRISKNINYRKIEGAQVR